HGLRDRVTDPARSFALADELRATGAQTCAVEVAASGHAMLERRGVWHTLTREFVLGTLGLAPLPSVIEHALTAESEHGARVLLGPTVASPGSGRASGGCPLPPCFRAATR